MGTKVVVWEWEEWPSLWIPYDPEVAQFIEGKYQLALRGPASETCVNLGEAHHTLMFYEVDLRNFAQTRMNGFGEQTLKLFGTSA